MREAFANQQPQTAVYWFGKERAARIGSTGSVISRLDLGKAYLVNDRAKSYTVIELGDDRDSETSSGAAEMVETGETRTIGSWQAKRWDMTLEMGGQTAHITLWVSDEVEFDLSAYRALIRATAAQTGADWMLEFLEADGFPVRQEVRMGPILSWQQVLEISGEAAPAGVYEPPPDFSRSD
jgi:hypothetical protein